MRKMMSSISYGSRWSAGRTPYRSEGSRRGAVPPAPGPWPPAAGPRPPRGPVYHIDLYRLEEAREAATLGLEEIFDRKRENRFLGSFGDHLIRVDGQHRENFRTVRGRQMRATRADSDFAFTRGAAVTQIFDNFRAESFHRVPASSLVGSALLYRRLRAPGVVATSARSIPATPRKCRRQ